MGSELLFVMSLEVFTFPDFEKRKETRHANWQYIVEFARVCRKSGIPIVEVGSGKAEIARWLMDRGHVHPDNMICVDPDPTSYSKDKQVHVSPKYKTVKHLLSEQPQLVGNCGLLVIRPSAIDANCYVIDALERLSPNIALLMYRADGGDGTCYLHNYLCDVGAPNSNTYDIVPASRMMARRDNKIRKDYKTVSFTYTKQVDDPSLLYVSSCVILTIIEIHEKCLPTGELNPDALSIEECKKLMFKSQLGHAGEIPNNCTLQ